MPPIPTVDAVLVPIAARADARRRLLELLAQRLGLEPDDVPMVEGDAGKPALDTAAGLPDLRFNLSHSGDRALIAIAEGVELGVDLERITPTRDRGYLEDWTRREAYAKGAGSGLAGGVRRLAFEPMVDGAWGVLDGGRRIDGWRIVDLDVGASLVAALAAESEVDVSLRLDPAVA